MDKLPDDNKTPKHSHAPNEGLVESMHTIVPAKRLRFILLLTKVENYCTSSISYAITTK